jgi:hypothetical protein
MKPRTKETALTEHPSEQAAPPAGSRDAAPTGHAAVDAVVDMMAGLDGRPVSEHVAVFEAAHDRLRDALAHAGDDTPTI